jgi:tetratricopeptide (TPR) repeat protein
MLAQREMPVVPEGELSVTEGLVARIGESWAVPAVLKPLDMIPKPGERNTKVYFSARDAKRLLDTNLASAELRARKSLEADPCNAIALYMLGSVRRRKGQFEKARATLEPLTSSQPQMEFAWFELGMALKGLGQRAQACEALLRSVDLKWVDQNAWYELGNMLPFPPMGSEAKREVDPRLAEVETALDENRLHDAEGGLNEMLKKNPRDVRATKLLADVMLLTSRWAKFETLIRECLEGAPDFIAARFRYVTMCFVRGKIAQILPHVEELLASDPANTVYRSLKALVLYHGQQIQPAINEFESILAGRTKQPGLWRAYAMALQAARHDNAAAAYTAAVDILPSFADAWLGLGHLTSFCGDEKLIARLETQLARPDLPEDDRAKLHYVLGRSFENSKRYAQSFAHYRTSNNILRSAGAGAASRDIFIQRAKSLFTPEFFHARQGWGCQENGPVFVVGMPRSGSTLVEQILSSHSSVEALGELTVVTRSARRFVPDRPSDPEGGYPNDLKNLDRDSVRLLGEEYLRATRVLRRRNTPLFVDKLPSNYLHIGLIRLALPNARIVDVRRHPLDCCFSCFKHYFAAGLAEATDLAAIGRAYVEYVELMAHFDSVLPGRVYRVIYENLIANPELEVRRMLDDLDLPFEQQCLTFHENDRFVRTISADQVNRPLYDTAVGLWRHYEQWLGPLKHELGYVVDAYPEAPKFYSGARLRSRNPLTLGQAGYRFDFVKGLRQRPFAVASGVPAEA